MGIKNLNTLLDEYCRNATTNQPLSNWTGKRMAIDLNNTIYIHMATAWKEVVNSTLVPMEDPDMDKVTALYLERFKQFLMKLFRNKITPVIVCDGPPPAEKETITRTKRREIRDNARVRCDDFKALLLEKDPLEITPSDIETMRTYMRQNTPVFTNDIETVKNVCTGLGLPILQSTSEAEILCSLLCRTGRVDLVYSTDTDNLVHGCPNMVKGFSGREYNALKGEMVDMVKVVNFHKTLEGIDMTYPEFVDMCIMCGCDYNTNIPRVGVKTSFKLIKKYGSIDNLPPKYDVTCLNHIRCRQIFAHQPYRNICEDVNVSLNVDIDSLSTYTRDVLEPYGVDHWISDLVDIYRDFPQDPVQVVMSPMGPYPRLEILDTDAFFKKVAGNKIDVLVVCESSSIEDNNMNNDNNDIDEDTPLNLNVSKSQYDVVIYTDGSSNQVRAGYGVVFTQNDQMVSTFKGPIPLDIYPTQTNNQSELYAILIAMKESRGYNKILIKSDSDYSIKSLTEWFHGWIKNSWKTSKGTDVLNKELIMTILAEINWGHPNERSITFEHINAHCGIKFNELADRLANEGRLEHSE